MKAISQNLAASNEASANDPSTLDHPAEDPPRRLFDLPPGGIPFTEDQQRLRELAAALLGDRP